MSKNLREWEKTKHAYTGWLANTELRLIFSNSITFKNLSIWWITKLIDKDTVLNNEWYVELNSIVNNKKKFIKKEKKLFFFVFKVIRKFISNIIFVSMIKIFYHNKNKDNLKKINCFYSFYENIVYFKKNSLDRQLGLAPIKNKKINSYLIQFQTNYKIFFKQNEHKKKLLQLGADYFILNRYISIKNIIIIYLQTFFLLFKLILILRKKNFFIIKGKDCSSVLKPLLIESFFGDIQDSLLNGLAVKNFLKKNNYKNFINYIEFFSGSRSIYHFIKSNASHPKIITIQHAIYSNNMLPYFLVKKEFCNDNDSLFYSPKPDIFFTQGTKYLKALKKIFPNNKIHVVGSFKLDLANFKFNKSLIKKKVYKSEKKIKQKKIISICTAINDERNIINFLNKCDLSNFLVIICPHPYYKKQSIMKFENYFKYNFKIFENLSTREIISISDFVICGYSSVGFEALLNKTKVIRLLDDSFPLNYDLNDGIRVIKDYKKLNTYLSKKFSFSKSFTKKIEKRFFYKFDNKTHLRFWSILKRNFI